MKRLLRLSIQRFGAIIGITGLTILSTTTSVFATSRHNSHPPSPSRPHVHTSTGVGGGTSKCKTSNVYVNPYFHWCARVTPSKSHKSSKSLPGGGGAPIRSLPKTPHSAPINTSPKKSSSHTRHTPSTPTVPQPYKTVSVLVPWTFNGCETNPAVTGTTQDPAKDLADAPGEPSGTPITPPSFYRLVLPHTAPDYTMGSRVRITPHSAPNYWQDMADQNATGHVLPGPGWGIESEETQTLLHTAHLVTSKNGDSIAWTTSKDGPPHWTAREIYAVNSCPYPTVSITTLP